MESQPLNTNQENLTTVGIKQQLFYRNEWHVEVIVAYDPKITEYPSKKNPEKTEKFLRMKTFIITNKADKHETVIIKSFDEAEIEQYKNFSRGDVLHIVGVPESHAYKGKDGSIIVELIIQPISVMLYDKRPDLLSNKSKVKFN